MPIWDWTASVKLRAQQRKHTGACLISTHSPTLLFGILLFESSASNPLTLLCMCLYTWMKGLGWSSPYTAILYGSVFQYNVDNESPEEKLSRISKAKKAFRGALKMDPTCIQAAIALTDCLIESRQYEKCVELLLNSMKNQVPVEGNFGRPEHCLQTKLGTVYLAMGLYGEAMVQFQHAISRCPNNSNALMGIEQIEVRSKQHHI